MRGELSGWRHSERHEGSTELRSSCDSCMLIDGIGGCVGINCRWCTSSSFIGEFGRERSTIVDVGTSVFVVDCMISETSDSSW